MPEQDPIRLSLVLTHFDDHHLQLAAQIGCSDVVARHPSHTGRSLEDMQQHANKFGLRIGAVEGYIPHDQVVHDGPGRDQQVTGFCELLDEMGCLGIPICCFNFMPNDDWCRTSVAEKERGGALVTAFRASDVGSDLGALNSAGAFRPAKPVAADELWERLVGLLQKICPVAEQSGVKLALHPDDPPVSTLNGHEHLLCNPESYERLFEAVPSDVNGMCFCQGTFATMGVNIPDTIRRFGDRIHYVHFRDVAGQPEDFRETFHDNGPTDMAAAMRAYRDIGFTGMMRPDHVPVLAGESLDQPGYTMMGRLHAVGYMRGLLDATR